MFFSPLFRIFLLLPLIFLLPLSAQALVLDQFKCTTRLEEVQTGRYDEQNFEFYIARKPLSQSYHPDVRMTQGQVNFGNRLDTGNNKYGVGVQFYYKHATRISESGQATEARQLSCLSVSPSYCDNVTGTCWTSAMSACLETLDPFNPYGPYRSVPIVNGIGAFNVADLNPMRSEIRDQNGVLRGLSTLNCQFIGTFD